MESKYEIAPRQIIIRNSLSTKSRLPKHFRQVATKLSSPENGTSERKASHLRTRDTKSTKADFTGERLPAAITLPYNNSKLSDDEPGAELPIRLGKETAHFVREKAKSKEPFFAMLSFYSVHGPIHCSEDRFKKFQAKAEKMGLTNRTDPRFKFDRTKEVRQVQDHPIYAGMMAALDDAVGLVLDAIDDAGRSRKHGRYFHL